MDAMPQIKKRGEPSLLGEALAGLMSQGKAGLEQRSRLADRIRTLWGQLLPPELSQHCRVVDLSQGLLTVEADSPSYMYEVRISSSQLIGFLRQGCPQAKIRAIKTILTA